jgi:hypothetical protein
VILSILDHILVRVMIDDDDEKEEENAAVA